MVLNTSLGRAGIFALAVTMVLAVFGSVGTAQAQTGGSPFQQVINEQPVDARFVFSVTSAAPGDTYAAAAVIEVNTGWHINSAHPYESMLIPASLHIDTLGGIVPKDIRFPQGHDVDLLGSKMSVYEGTTIVRLAVEIASDVSPGAYDLPVTLSFQACNSTQCLAPDKITGTLRVVVGTLGSLTDTSVFSDYHVAATETGNTTSPVGADAEPVSDLQRLIDEHGAWGYVLALGLAFITGLLLSFSPCTYPMVPITVSIFAGQQRSIGRGFALSLVYVGSMAVVYGVMGLVVSLVGGVFGAWLAAPPVVIAIAIIFVLFSLSMFGLYELQPPLWLRQKIGTGHAGGGGLSVIILGVIAALVVSPCVGPFVAGILLYVATSGSPVLGFLILFVFAVGLGTLYVIIGTFSNAINNLPNAGVWMETVKKFFGFVLLLMALYFLRTIVPTSTLAVLTALLLLAFGVFGGGLDRLTSEAGFFLRLKKLLGLLALTVGMYLFVGSLLTGGLLLPPVSQWLPFSGGAVSSEQKEPIAWYRDLETGLNAARQEGKPVLIDTWATWCANCRVLDEKTFHHPDVVRVAEDFVAIKVQLEKADAPATRDFMKRFDLKQYSLPTVLLLDRTGKLVRILQGVVEPGDMIEEMRRAATP